MTTEKKLKYRVSLSEDDMRDILAAFGESMGSEAYKTIHLSLAKVTHGMLRPNNAMSVDGKYMPVNTGWSKPITNSTSDSRLTKANQLVADGVVTMLRINPDFATLKSTIDTITAEGVDTEKVIAEIASKTGITITLDSSNLPDSLEDSL